MTRPPGPRSVRQWRLGWMKIGALAAVLLLLGTALVLLFDPGATPAPTAPSSPEEPPETSAAVPGAQATDPSLPGQWDRLPAASSPMPEGIQTIQVQVVDEKGAPREGVPVALLAAGRLLDRTWTAGAQGLARFAWPPGGEQPVAAPAVVLAFPHADPAPVPIDPDSLPVEPLRLILPPYGSVIVRLSDSEGGAVRDRLPVTLSGYDTGDGVGSRVAGYACTIESEEGEARFPFAGLGLDLGLSLGGAATRGPGPRRVGETVRFALTLQKRAFLELTIVGRVLKPDGEPLSGLECSWSLHPADYEREGTPEGRSRFRTDTSGGFRLSAGAGLDARGERRFLLLVTTLSTLEGSDLVSAEVELQLPFASGEIHAGDIPLASVPLATSGTVRDEAGSPVAGARVTAEVHRQVPEGWSVATMEGGYSEGEWYWDHLAQAQADAAGRFRIQAFCKAALVGLQASAGGLLSNERLCVPLGAAGVDLVLGKPGRLEGSVLLSPGISPEILSVRLVAPPDETVEQGTPGPDGTFRLEKIPPGAYRLELALARECQPLWSLPGLEIAPGKPPADPRLQRIDLRGRIRVIELLVEDERGRPIPGARATLLAEGTTIDGLPGPGRYRVCWSWLELRPTERVWSGLAGSCSVPEIQVLDQEQEQRFSVRLGMDGEAWRKLLERKNR